MVKGRRKRGSTVTVMTRSSALVETNGSIVSPLKKEIKLEKDQGENRKLGMGQKKKNNPLKSPVSITSYFTKTNGFNNKISNEKITEFIKTEDVLLKAEHDVKEEIDDNSPIEKLFKTDETPVAVPCQNPSTPHRINMPTIQSDDSDTRSSTESNDAKPMTEVVVNGHTTKDKEVRKKITGNVRGKLKYTEPIIHVNSPKSAVAKTNHKVTEYFPVRRSVRKCKKTVLEEKQRDLENKVLCQVEEGLMVKHFVGKGRGVVTTREFKKGEFVVEYIGDLIDQVAAKKREAEYAKDQNTGCYMYYFQHRNHQYCVDATAETDKLGRLVNHSRNGNLIARVIEVESIPHLVLTAKEDIPMGVEINYDYGDRSREAIQNHPWLLL
ncbi:N-lysine methyltransferase KMT5A [Microplitis mediator]|uniref:N-lysine methyltransferase KMT5A n=1 Tax=Microplitis mediator TaxID=375433 RepID=UPI002552A7DA|nr:N-lysine methyltransferase KMT5A [Microplitis mediator]